MAEIFTTSGEKSGNIVAPTPRLQGLFVPGIDNSLAVDGFGIVTPWGGGGTARRYSDYGISGDISQQTTQLGDLASSLIPAEGAGITYNWEGLVGPQGIPGRDGLDGIIHIMGLNLPQNSNFLAALPHNIDQINDLGTAVDRLIYTETYTTTTYIAGTDLCTGTTDGDTLPVNPNFEEREITFDTPVELTNGSKYTIVVNAASRTGAAQVHWGARIDNPYANGDCYASPDSGSSWVIRTDSDVWFKTKADGVVKEDGSFTSVGDFFIFGVEWSAQTFIASSTYTISSVILELQKLISGGGEPGIVTVTIRSVGSYSEATWAESALTSAGRALLDDADAPAQATTLGLGSGDTPEFVNTTLSGLTASRLIASDAGKKFESVPGTSIHPEFEGTTIKDSGDNIIFYVDDDEMYFTASIVIPIEAGMSIGLLLSLTYASP